MDKGGAFVFEDLTMESNIKHIISIQSGEKATRLMQEQNKITFIVNPMSNKIEIKIEAERLFDIKISSINVMNRMNGQKIAIAKLKQGYNAMDIATRLGLV